MSIGKRAAAWLSRLVQIPSVTPAQAGARSGIPGEQEIARQVAAWFHSLGGQVEQEEVLSDRPNIYGLWPGQTGAWVAVDVHLDTVGVEGMSGDPFSGEIRDGRVWGRGAADTKASLGVILALLEHIQESGQTPIPSLLIGATVDEETGSTGAPAFAAWQRRQPFQVMQIVVAEPTECIPVYGHRGAARFELTFHGVSAHTSQPERGKNAINAAARTIVAYMEEEARLQTLPPAAVGRPTLTVSIIHGGSGLNVVPDRCTVQVDRRVVDGEHAAAVTDALYEMAQQAGGLPVELRRLREMNAFLQSPDSPWIRQLAEWSERAPQVAPYGTNAWAYADLPAECVVIGPGSIAQAHSAEEWVEIAQLEKLAMIYARWWGIALE
ncbi:MAG TPA: M20/M25/M40 family metallo-hydrolase [Caldilineaceae bacterium]|nr:M20/M25/M40 family metallo-hydrolase [Caldilineaceae bacterium]